MDSAGCVFSMRKQAAEGALLVGMDPTGGESPLRKEAKEESGKMVGTRSQMQRRAEEPLRLGAKAMKPNSKQKKMTGRRTLQHVTYWADIYRYDEDAGRPEESVRTRCEMQRRAEEPTIGVEDCNSAMPPDEDAGRPEESVKKESMEGADEGSGERSDMAQEISEMVRTRYEMQRRAEEPTIGVEDCNSAMPPEYREKLLKRNELRAAKWIALLANYEKISASKRSGNSAGSQPADPSATKSATSLGQYSVQDDLGHDRGKPATPAVANRTAAEELESHGEHEFASYRGRWVSQWGKSCGLFTDTTVLSSMQFTPGCSPCSSSCSTPETLQIFSIGLSEQRFGLEFPLSVYGVVAVRDTVDRNRNLLFYRDISKAQEVKENDPHLHLIGPSRAIVNTDEVCIEIELKVKGLACSKYKELSLLIYPKKIGSFDVTGCIMSNPFCTLSLHAQLVEQTVQATVLGVQVVKDDGSLPFEYGGQVACSPLTPEMVATNTATSSRPIVLIDSKDEAMPKGSSGYLHLWRQVVSVHLQGGLDVVIKAYSESGAIAEETRVRFYPKVCNISQMKCVLGDAKVTITVAWSRVATSKTGVALKERGKSARPLANKMAADKEGRFASYRSFWESKWSKTCGLFTDTTVLSSMQFTHYTPGRRPYSSSCSTLETLQIFSIKLTRIDGGLGFPLSVYGVIAVRDLVDRNRNLLFSRDISEAQELKQNDPFLHLIGPSRAIVNTDKVRFEIELKVKGVAGSQDTSLISCVRLYMGRNGPGISTICFKNVFCTLELCLQPVEQTVQATILGVEVVRADGSWPLEYGGLVACSPLTGKILVRDGGFRRNLDPSTSQIVLVDSKDEAVLKGHSCYVNLWRQVVSVKLEGVLDVVIQAYSKSGSIAAETRARFTPKVCNISQKKCVLQDAEVTITVAWSLVATSKMGVALPRRFV